MIALLCTAANAQPYPLFCSSEAPIPYSACLPLWQDSVSYQYLDSNSAPNYAVTQTGCSVVTVNGVTATLKAGSGSCSLAVTTNALVMTSSTGSSTNIVNFTKQDWAQLTYAPDGVLRIYGPDSVLFEASVQKSWTATDIIFGNFSKADTGAIVSNSQFSLLFNAKTGRLYLSSASPAIELNIYKGGAEDSYTFQLLLNGSYKIEGKTAGRVYFSNFGGYVYPHYLTLQSNGDILVVNRFSNRFSAINICGPGKTFSSGSCADLTCTSPCATCTNTTQTCKTCVANAQLRGSRCFCSGGYYFSAGCVACPTGCSNCTSGVVCTKCSPSYYMNNQQCSRTLTELRLTNVVRKNVDLNILLLNFSASVHYTDTTTVYHPIFYPNGAQPFLLPPVLRVGSSHPYHWVYVPITGNGTLCLTSNGPTDSAGTAYYFSPICQSVGSYGATPGTSLSQGYSVYSLLDPNFQFFNVACVISITAIFIALYYYRLELVQLQTTFVYFIQLLYILGLSNNSYITPLQNLLSGFAFSHLLFVPNFFALASSVYPSQLFSKNSQLLGGDSFIFNAGPSVSALLLALVAFLVLLILEKVQFLKEYKKLIFSDSTYMRGKYFLLFILSLLEFNLFYFSILELRNFVLLASPSYYQRVNAGFAGLCLALCSISLLCYLAYNYYVNYHTPENEKFSFKIAYDWAVVPYAAIEGLRRLLFAILLGCLYTSPARATILVVEGLYAIWVVSVARHWKYKLWLALHELLALAIVALLLFELRTEAALALIIIDSAIFLLFTWHYDPQDVEERSLKVIEV